MPNKIHRIALITSLFIIGCSSWNKKNSSVVLTAPENNLLNQYIEAKKNSDCAGFQKLATEKKFPLQKLAALRAQENCVFEDWQKEWTAFNTENPPDVWMISLADEIQLKKSEENKNWDIWQNISSRLIAQQNNASSKITMIQKTQRKARNFGLTNYTQELQKKLEQVAPRFNTHPSESELIRVADDLRRSRQFKKARAYYQQIIKSDKSSFELKNAAYEGIRRSYKTQRAHEQHLSTLLKIYQFHKQNNPENKAQLMDTTMAIVRAEWTLGRADQALARLEKAIENFGKAKISLAEAHWLKGKIYEERADWDKAYEAYLQTQNLKMNGDLADQIRWSLAWSARKQKKYDVAAESLQALVDQTKSQSVKTRANFWLAKTFRNMNKEKEAVALYEKLIEEDPFNFYSLLGNHELDRHIEHQKGRSIASEFSVTTCDWLEKAGETDLIDSYVQGEAANLAQNKNENVSDWANLLNCAGRTGNYSLAFEKFNTLSQNLKNKIINQYPELLFPNPWKEIVVEAAAKHKVEPELIYAIMRQESSFNPRARSPMDAFGLLQVLPEVANIVSKKSGRAIASYEDLYKPELNIPIGAQLLRSLSQKHDDQLLLTIACYNADERAVLGWVKTRFQNDVSEFIEDIPYEETRSYVKLVLRNYIYYKLFLSEKMSVAFPSHFLQLKANVAAQIPTEEVVQGQTGG